MVLAELLDRGQVWRGSEAPVHTGQSVLETGYPELDICLNGGWVPGHLIELLIDKKATGELSLLLPLLSDVSHKSGLILWIDPPMAPYSLALAQSGVRLRDHRIIRTGSLDERLWVMEQALKSGCVSLLVGWLDVGRERVSDKALRRLQLAADKGQGLAFVVRSSSHINNSSPASFRLHLKQSEAGVKVDLIKRYQSWPVEGPVLPLLKVG